jgi:hypothetical protein
MNPSETTARIGHLHSHTPRQPAEPDADRLLGSDTGVAHGIGHKLGPEEKDIRANGVRPAPLLAITACLAGR